MPSVELATRISNKMKMAAAAGISPDDLWVGYIANRPNPNSSLKPIDVLKAVGIPINYPEYYIAVRDRANGSGKNIPYDSFLTICTELAEGEITPINRRPTERFRPDEVPQTPEQIEETITSYVQEEEKETYYLLDAARVARIPYHDSTIDDIKKTAIEIGIDANGTKVPMNLPEFKRLCQVLLENKPKVEPDWLEKWMDEHSDREDFKMKDVYSATRRDETEPVARRIREYLREIDNGTADSKFVSMTRDEFTLVSTMVGVVNPYKSEYTSRKVKKPEQQADQPQIKDLDQTLTQINERRESKIDFYIASLSRKLSVQDIAHFSNVEFDRKTTQLIRGIAQRNEIDIESVWSELTPDQFKKITGEILARRFSNLDGVCEWINKNPKDFYSLGDVITASGIKLNKNLGSATVRGIGEKLNIDVSAPRPKLSASEVLLICSEIPQKRVQTYTDIEMTEGKVAIIGADLVKKKRAEFTAANNPRVWVSENEKPDYGIEDIILATGRKTTTDKNVQKKVRDILVTIGDDPTKRFNAEQVIRAAEAYGPPIFSSNRKPDYSIYLNELGITPIAKIEVEAPVVLLYPGQDPKLAKMAELLNKKRTRTGEKPTKDSEDTQVPRIMSIRQEAGCDLAEKILSSLNNQVIENLNVELDKNPNHLIENIDLPQKYMTALKSLTEDQAKEFVTQTTKEVIEKAWSRNDISVAGQNIDRHLGRYIHSLTTAGIKLGEILYYIYNYYGVPIPSEDPTFIRSDLLIDRKLRVRGPRHGKSAL